MKTGLQSMWHVQYLGLLLLSSLAMSLDFPRTVKGADILHTYRARYGMSPPEGAGHHEEVHK